MSNNAWQRQAYLGVIPIRGVKPVIKAEISITAPLGLSEDRLINAGFSAYNSCIRGFMAEYAAFYSGVAWVAAFF